MESADGLRQASRSTPSKPSTKNAQIPKIQCKTIGATSVSDGSSLAPFGSPTEVRPVAIANWNLRIVAFNAGSRVRVLQLEFDGLNQVTLGPSDIRRLQRYDQVVAVVAYDEPTETQSQYAPYTLTVNGVVQPGGS